MVSLPKPDRLETGASPSQAPEDYVFEFDAMEGFEIGAWLLAILALGLPWRFIIRLMNFSAAALSRTLLAKDSSTSPSWSTARHR